MREAGHAPRNDGARFAATNDLIVDKEILHAKAIDRADGTFHLVFLSQSPDVRHRIFLRGVHQGLERQHGDMLVGQQDVHFLAGDRLGDRRRLAVDLFGRTFLARAVRSVHVLDRRERFEHRPMAAEFEIALVRVLSDFRPSFEFLLGFCDGRV